MHRQRSSTVGFDRPIDAASIATLADLGMSETQIARYRGLWCREKPFAVVRAGARRAATESLASCRFSVAKA
jgi:hypothetical protein